MPQREGVQNRSDPLCGYAPRTRRKPIARCSSDAVRLRVSTERRGESPLLSRHLQSLVPVSHGTSLVVSHLQFDGLFQIDAVVPAKVEDADHAIGQLDRYTFRLPTF